MNREGAGVRFTVDGLAEDWPRWVDIIHAGGVLECEAYRMVVALSRKLCER